MGQRLWRMRVWIITLGFAFGLAAGSMAQNQQSAYLFDALTTDDGLSSNSVVCMTRDGRGFLWVGTQNGLNRFDGYKFITFHAEQDGETGLAHHAIHAMDLDVHGRLWVATRGGLNRIDCETLRIERIGAPADPQNRLPAQTLESLLIGQSGALWVGSAGGGLFQLNEEGCLVRVTNSHSFGGHGLRDDDVWSLAEGIDGALWVGTRRGGLHRVTDNDVTCVLPDIHDIYALVREPESETLWLGTLDQGLIRFDPRTRGVFVFSDLAEADGKLNDHRIWSLMWDRERRLWAGTDEGGIAILDPVTHDLQVLSKSLVPRHGLNDQSVYCMVQDPSGVIWAGTLYGGLNKLRRTPFHRLLTTQSEPARLSHDNVRCIAEGSDGTIWIGTRGGGLDGYDPETDRIKVRFQEGEPSNLSSNLVWALASSVNHGIWVGTDAGLHFLATKTGDLREIVPKWGCESRAPLRDINCLLEDRAGTLWVGTWGHGVVRITPSDQSAIRFEVQGEGGLSHDKIFTVFEDRHHQILVGSRGGLDLFLGQDRGFRCLGKGPGSGQEGGLTHDYVSCLLEDDRGDLWVGTWGGGLNRWLAEARAERRARFVPVRNAQGLEPRYVSGLLMDDKGRLWIGSTRGLYAYDPDNGRFQHFSADDGLQGHDFNPKACCLARDGTAYFGGTNGINVFQPGRFQASQFTPPVVITSFQVFHEDRRMEGLAGHGPPLMLPHTENNFSFEFSVLDYSSARKNQYAYRLRGLDRDWVQTDAQNRKASYTHVPPGSYLFEVIGGAGHSLWNEQGTRLEIIIAPPVWDRIWFRLLALGLIGALIMSGLHLRTRNLERQRNQLQAMVAAKTQELLQNTQLLERQNQELRHLNHQKNEFLGIVVHDMRNPLAAIVWLLRLYLKARNAGEAHEAADDENLEVALAEAERLKSIAGQLVDSSAIESGRIRLSLCDEDLRDILRHVVKIHQVKAREKGIQLRLSQGEGTVMACVDRSRFVEMLDNLIDNAIKYTEPGGWVHVFLDSAEEFVDLHVEDSGVGLEPDELSQVFLPFRRLSAKPTAGETSTGLGLTMVKKIMDLHGGEVLVRSEKGQGSRFTLRLPKRRPEHRETMPGA